MRDPAKDDEYEEEHSVNVIIHENPSESHIAELVEKDTFKEQVLSLALALCCEIIIKNKGEFKKALEIILRKSLEDHAKGRRAYMKFIEIHPHDKQGENHASD